MDGLLLSKKRCGYEPAAESKRGPRVSETLYEDVRTIVPRAESLFEPPR